MLETKNFLVERNENGPYSDETLVSILVDQFHQDKDFFWQIVDENSDHPAGCFCVACQAIRAA